MSDVVQYPIEDVTLGNAMSERYLAYALSTITARSLPDVRDGMKPVHRRLLYAMHGLRLYPEARFKKCARIVGDVMGKFHPHGDQAIYDAMVRLAQEFSVRYPLVEGMGNFGNIDGDNPAAMRYTEARLSVVAELLLQGINDAAVDFRETYDGEGAEPVVLPASFPNLLANGATGIAVGMATSIPPHNLTEICDGLLHLLHIPECEVVDLVQFIKAPDFPTGGIIYEPRETLLACYQTGKGSVRVRARWQLEQLGRGQWQIAITQIPYQVNKLKLVERLADLILSKKTPVLSDISDESAEDVRLVLVPANPRNITPEEFMEILFAMSELENRISINMNALDDFGRVPKLMDLKQLLQGYLDHRFQVLQNISVNRLGIVNDRLIVLSGLLICYANLDEIIAIIREQDEPKPIMMKRFDLLDVQADSILNMRLRSLRKLAEIEIRKETKNLERERAQIEKLLASDKIRKNTIVAEINDLHKKALEWKDVRMSDIHQNVTAAPTSTAQIQARNVVREPITVVLSTKGWIRALKGHVDADMELKFKQGDELRTAFHANTGDRVAIFSQSGKFYNVLAHKLPDGRGYGEPLSIVADCDINAQEIAGLLSVYEDQQYLLSSSDGRGFVADGSALVAQTRNGRQVLSPGKDALMLHCTPIKGSHVALIGDNRRLLIFPVSEIPVMNKGKGVILQRYKTGSLVDVTTLDLEDGLHWSSGSRTRTQTDLTLWIDKRAQRGNTPPHGFPRNNRFA